MTEPDDVAELVHKEIRTGAGLEQVLGHLLDQSVSAATLEAVERHCRQQSTAPGDDWDQTATIVRHAVETGLFYDRRQ